MFNYSKDWLLQFKQALYARPEWFPQYNREKAEAVLKACQGKTAFGLLRPSSQGDNSFAFSYRDSSGLIKHFVLEISYDHDTKTPHFFYRAFQDENNEVFYSIDEFFTRLSHISFLKNNELSHTLNPQN